MGTGNAVPAVTVALLAAGCVSPLMFGAVRQHGHADRQLAGACGNCPVVMSREGRQRQGGTEYGVCVARQPNGATRWQVVVTCNGPTAYHCRLVVSCVTKDVPSHCSMCALSYLAVSRLGNHLL